MSIVDRMFQFSSRGEFRPEIARRWLTGFRNSFWALLSLLVVDSSVCLAQPPKSMLVDVPAGRFVGLPIHWSSRDIALLEPSGQIQVFRTNEVAQHRILDDFFRPQSMQQASLELQAELGPDFETLVAGPYVIGAPKGESQRWESRFRALLAGYARYFEVRGWPIRPPDFPLIVIVLPSRDQFFSMGSKEIGGQKLASNLAGMYVPRTNRCLLYHLSHEESLTNWEATEATIVHEAVHQLAYNTGAHERLFEHPLWFVEGLATMFEVPAVYDSRVQTSNIETRMHLEKLAAIRDLKLDATRLGAYLQSLVSDDDLFATEPELAYTLSWALTFYLVERMPLQYFELVTLQRSRGFQLYGPGDRQMDFRTAFQTTPEQLAPQVLQLLGEF